MNPKDEPVAWGGALTGVAVAVFPVLTAFGVHITQDQISSLLVLLGALIVLVTFVVRSRVTPVDKAQGVIDAAYLTQPGDPKPVLK